MIPSDSATVSLGVSDNGWACSTAVAVVGSFRSARNVPPAPTATQTIARMPLAVLVIS
jgi:hypothetical protein